MNCHSLQSLYAIVLLGYRYKSSVSNSRANLGGDGSVDGSVDPEVIAAVDAVGGWRCKYCPTVEPSTGIGHGHPAKGFFSTRKDNFRNHIKRIHSLLRRENETMDEFFRRGMYYLQHDVPQQAMEVNEHCRFSDKPVQYAKARSADSGPHPQDSHHLQEPDQPENSQPYSRLMHDPLRRPGTGTALQLLPMERFLLLYESDCASVHDLFITKTLLLPHSEAKVYGSSPGMLVVVKICRNSRSGMELSTTIAKRAKR
ncbi:hypothetical protein BDZ91DRAFT_766756 [Kalaharituber pfeilii]|nr:hypothetical protein BDZ91DRAFT_766756 [Kalaharituber pfeilii]